MDETPVTSHHQAYEFIKDQIMKLRLKPGAYVIDTQIAHQLNISRTPVREAFYRLEKEGLLVNEARRGWRVYTLSLHDIHEIFDLKEVIEGMVARKAAACTDPALRAALKDVVDEMEAAGQAENTEAWLNADMRLHEVLFEMAGNDRAYRTVSNLNDQWHRVRIGFVALQGRTQRSSAEHRAIIESIVAGNGEEAEQRMRAHLNQVRGELTYLLETVVLPFAYEGV